MSHIKIAQFKFTYSAHNEPKCRHRFLLLKRILFNLVGNRFSWLNFQAKIAIVGYAILKYENIGGIDVKPAE